MARTPELPDRVAVNVRAEMAAQRKTSVELASILGIGHRATLRRVNGEHPFSLGEIETTAAWLGVAIATLMAPRAVVEAVSA